MFKLRFFFISLSVTLSLCLFGNTSILIDSPYPDHQIEILLEKSSNEDCPLLLFLHGAEGQGLSSISKLSIDYWLCKGYAVAAISMPGYGQSTGKKDCCGPFTLSSLNAAIEVIKDRLNVSDFGIIGFGQGGLAGVLLTTQRDDIRCLVCANGAYDLFRHREANDLLISRLKNYFDVNDDEALSYRSPLFLISAIHTPVFVLHRVNNCVVSEKEALDFYDAMLQAGKECCITIRDRDRDEDKISHEEVVIETENWVNHHMNNVRKES